VPSREAERRRARSNLARARSSQGRLLTFQRQRLSQLQRARSRRSLVALGRTPSALSSPSGIPRSVDLRGRRASGLFRPSPLLPGLERAGRELSFPSGTSLQQQILAVLPTVGFSPRASRDIAKRSARNISRALRKGRLVNLPGFIAGVTPGGLTISEEQERERAALRRVPANITELALSSGQNLAAIQSLQNQLNRFNAPRLAAGAQARVAQLAEQITELGGEPVIVGGQG